MLVCGSPTLDMEELRKVTVYDGFHEDEPLIRHVICQLMRRLMRADVTVMYFLTESFGE